MEKDEQIKPKIVQTYAQDMAKVIEDHEGGMIKKIIHGEEESEAERKNLSPQSRKNRFLMYLGLLFILLALGILFFFFFVKDNSTVPIEEQFVPLIFNDTSTYLEVKDLTKDKIAQTVSNEVNGTEVKNGGVEGIYLTENNKQIGLRDFIELISAKFIPGNIVFVNDKFLLGVVNEGTKDFFMLIKVRSLPDAFDSLHAWESEMFSDLHGFFGISTGGETRYLLTKNFEDGVIENKNARILYDTNNKIVMMYIFANDTSIVFTNTENAARELILRLASSQIKK